MEEKTEYLFEDATNKIKQHPVGAAGGAIDRRTKEDVEIIDKILNSEMITV